VLLLDPLTLRGSSAPSRVLFGPIVTNLGDDDRRFTARHTDFYAARAAGGAGIIVTEEASVHASDWPYERAPLAERCGDGWREIVSACEPHGALVVAALGHTGGQGSSAYSQAPLLAPSRVPEVNSREVPKWMEPDDIAAVVAGFAAATKVALDAGCAGVEVNAGQHSLVRQFLSGLTNHRGDEWGADRLHFAQQVLATVRAAAGDGPVGLRLSCDELAPWAGITAEMAPGIAAALAEHVDYVVVTRGSIYSIEKTRPDFHEPPGFNIDVCRAVRAELPGSITVVLQGSVVDPAQAEWALGEGLCDVVEMTRAQLADPALVRKLREGAPEQVRPCIRCNQTCQVRDARNPIISCVGEPSTGFEGRDPEWTSPTARPRDVVVVGGGPAGLETARVAAARGHRVRLVERADRLGGMAAVAGPGGPLVEWLEREVHRLGVDVVLGAPFDAAASAGALVVQCTGSVAGEPPYEIADGAIVVGVDAWRAGADLPADGAIVVYDPIGGPIGVAAAEDLGARAVLVTQDQIAGNELSRTGDLAPANVRLQQKGVTIERRSLLREARAGEVELEDRFSGERRTVACAAVLDCGFRLPDAPLAGARLQAGDCVAPRTIAEAILEGRRAALALDRA
jgi:2,4-dienoyl-CoA reductase (NADPH2)